MSMLQVRLEQLKELEAIQSRDGTWDLHEYNHGISTGLKLALSTMTGRQLPYHKPPANGYAGLKPSAKASKAVPPGNELGKSAVAAAITTAIAPISPERLGEMMKVKAPPPVLLKEPTSAPPATKEKETMAKKAKPAPKKPKPAPAAKAKAKIGKVIKAKAPKKAATKRARKGAKRARR